MSESFLDFSLPLEILQEFIKQTDDSQTLAAWTLVSRPFLAHAGPLLYQTVSLTRPGDVIPFLKRILLRPSAPFPLLPIHRLQRLEILAPTPVQQLIDLLRISPVRREPKNLVVAIKIPDGHSEPQIQDFHVPILLHLLQPTRFDEVQTFLHELRHLDGPLLRSYLIDVAESISPENPEISDTVYEYYVEYISDQRRWLQDRETIQTALDLNLPDLVPPALADLIQQLQNTVEEANGLLLVPPGYVGDSSELSFTDMLQLASGLEEARRGQFAAPVRGEI